MNYSNVAFFGDSWVYGDELDDNNDSFPNLLGAKNFAKSGSSNPGLIQRFYEVDKNFKTAIFCLTEASRIIYYGDKNNYIDTQYIKDDHPLHSTHQKLMSLSSDYDQDMKVSQTCYILYNWCKKLDIVPYFINIWTSQLGESFIWNLISKDSFLLPITNNLVKKLFDTQKFFPDKDTPQDFGIWRTTRNNDFYTFIYPNTGHPNIKGHQIFANWFKNNINKSI